MADHWTVFLLEILLLPSVLLPAASGQLNGVNGGFNVFGRSNVLGGSSLFGSNAIVRSITAGVSSGSSAISGGRTQGQRTTTTNQGYRRRYGSRNRRSTDHVYESFLSEQRHDSKLFPRVELLQEKHFKHLGRRIRNRLPREERKSRMKRQAVDMPFGSRFSDSPMGNARLPRNGQRVKPGREYVPQETNTIRGDRPMTTRSQMRQRQSRIIRGPSPMTLRREAALLQRSEPGPRSTDIALTPSLHTSRRQLNDHQQQQQEQLPTNVNTNGLHPGGKHVNGPSPRIVHGPDVKASQRAPTNAINVQGVESLIPDSQVLKELSSGISMITATIEALQRKVEAVNRPNLNQGVPNAQLSSDIHRNGPSNEETRFTNTNLGNKRLPTALQAVLNQQPAAMHQSNQNRIGDLMPNGQMTGTQHKHNQFNRVDIVPLNDRNQMQTLPNNKFPQNNVQQMDKNTGQSPPLAGKKHVTRRQHPQFAQTNATPGIGNQPNTQSFSTTFNEHNRHQQLNDISSPVATGRMSNTNNRKQRQQSSKDLGNRRNDHHNPTRQTNTMHKKQGPHTNFNNFLSSNVQTNNNFQPQRGHAPGGPQEHSQQIQDMPTLDEIFSSPIIKSGGGISVPTSKLPTNSKANGISPSKFPLTSQSRESSKISPNVPELGQNSVKSHAEKRRHRKAPTHKQRLTDSTDNYNKGLQVPLDKWSSNSNIYTVPEPFKSLPTERVSNKDPFGAKSLWMPAPDAPVGLSLSNDPFKTEQRQIQSIYQGPSNFVKTWLSPNQFGAVLGDMMSKAEVIPIPRNQNTNRQTGPLKETQETLSPNGRRGVEQNPDMQLSVDSVGKQDTFPQYTSKGTDTPTTMVIDTTTTTTTTTTTIAPVTTIPVLINSRSRNIKPRNHKQQRADFRPSWQVLKRPSPPTQQPREMRQQKFKGQVESNMLRKKTINHNQNREPTLPSQSARRKNSGMQMRRRIPSVNQSWGNEWALPEYTTTITDNLIHVVTDTTTKTPVKTAPVRRPSIRKNTKPRNHKQQRAEFRPSWQVMKRQNPPTQQPREMPKQTFKGHMESNSFRNKNINHNQNRKTTPAPLSALSRNPGMQMRRRTPSVNRSWDNRWTLPEYTTTGTDNLIHVAIETTTLPTVTTTPVKRPSRRRNIKPKDLKRQRAEFRPSWQVMKRQPPPTQQPREMRQKKFKGLVQSNTPRKRTQNRNLNRETTPPAPSAFLGSPGMQMRRRTPNGNRSWGNPWTLPEYITTGTDNLSHVATVPTTMAPSTTTHVIRAPRRRNIKPRNPKRQRTQFRPSWQVKKRPSPTTQRPRVMRQHKPRGQIEPYIPTRGSKTFKRNRKPRPHPKSALSSDSGIQKRRKTPEINRSLSNRTPPISHRRGNIAHAFVPTSPYPTAPPPTQPAIPVASTQSTKLDLPVSRNQVVTIGQPLPTPVPTIQPYLPNNPNYPGTQATNPGNNVIFSSLNNRFGHPSSSAEIRMPIMRLPNQTRASSPVLNVNLNVNKTANKTTITNQTDTIQRNRTINITKEVRIRHKPAPATPATPASYNIDLKKTANNTTITNQTDIKQRNRTINITKEVRTIHQPTPATPAPNNPSISIDELLKMLKPLSSSTTTMPPPTSTVGPTGSQNPLAALNMWKLLGAMQGLRNLQKRVNKLKKTTPLPLNLLLLTRDRQPICKCMSALRGLCPGELIDEGAKRFHMCKPTQVYCCEDT